MRGSSLLRIAVASALAVAVLASDTRLSARPAGKTCPMPAGWQDVAARRTRYVIFGEVHGTRESPALVFSLACALASQGEKVLVGVEQQATDNEALQQAWRLPDTRFGERLRTIGRAGRVDGVASLAMFELLAGLHGLKARGRRVDIVAFNGARDEQQGKRFSSLPGQGPHEAAQAENIRIAAAAERYEHVLILVGNQHARKTPLGEGPTRFEPMAMRLAPASDITSLNMRHAAGAMWNCLIRPGFHLDYGKDVPAGAIDCGSHPAPGTPAEFATAPRLILGAFPGEPVDANYDGFYWLGPVSGSPPAVPAAAADAK